MNSPFQRINPMIPMVDVMPGLLNPGHEITFIGSTPPNATRFSINLQCGPNTSPRDDVALHLTADFTRRLFLRNSIHSMSWGMEENQGGMPLNPGQQFHITIVVEASQFTIAVNQTAFRMNHRMPYQRITHLTIDGDVMINEIRHRPSGAVPPNVYGASYPPNATSYPPNAAPYPAGNYASPSGGYPNNTYVQPNQKSGPLGQLGTALGVGGGAVGAAIAARSLKPKKIMKHQKKMAKKAMKYGIPIAGAGVGAYALGKVLHGHHHHHGHHWGSSSSSSSSSSS